MYKLIYVTASSRKEAQKIARILIAEKLVACTNIFPINSIYRWRGKICEEKEHAMIIKTKSKLVRKVIKRVKELHSYEIPCIVSLSIEEGYQKFLEWIDKETMQE